MPHRSSLPEPLRVSSDPTREEVARLWTRLETQHSLRYMRFSSGLFPASPCGPQSEYTGYQAAWVGDNVHVAHAHHALGHHRTALAVMRALCRYFRQQRGRFEAIVAGVADLYEPMNRPHIRCAGETLDELPGRWAHAQNDALGYFAWLFALLVADGTWTPKDDEWAVLAWFPPYFQAIQYWQDADNGHWEEASKVEASSIGVVLAALDKLRTLLQVMPSLAHRPGLKPELLDSLVRRGRQALAEILPWETREPVSSRRETDAALLFLIHPLHIVDDATADQIIHHVQQQLEGPLGICRYRGDSFWCADYKKKLRPELRTSDWSGHQAERDTWAVAGYEAQWTLFDSILSTIYGRRYRSTHDPRHRRLQLHYLNRALDQFTPDGYLPELYYFEDGRWQPNDVVPLYWSQANLQVALHTLEATTKRPADAVGNDA